MSTMTFGLRLTAQDETQSALRSAVSGVASFARTLAKPITIPLQIARGGLALLRDVQQGLMPLLRGMDDIVSKGAGLEAIQKSFASLTGRSADDAGRLANKLVAAAGGLLDDSKAMQLANRALAGGVDAVRDLPVIFEFAAKKAVSMGMDAASMLDQIFSGFMRGSTRGFEPLGILQKGTEGVQRAFDAIKGAGAFDALGPAAQQAEMISQAVAEMRAQMGHLGISGRETIFMWSGLKNQIGDAVDELVISIAKSETLRDTVSGLREVFSGLKKHFEGGGTIWEALTGKGKSGGLLGFLKAGLLDVAEMAGRGLLGGILKGLSKLPDLGKWLWEGLGSAFDLLSNKLQGVFEPVKQAITDLATWFKEKLGPVIDWLGQKFGDIFPKMESGTPGFGTQVMASSPRGGAAAAGLGLVHGGRRLWGLGTDWLTGADAGARERSMGQSWESWQHQFGADFVPGVGARAQTPGGALPFPLMGITRAALMGLAAGMMKETIWEEFGRWGDAILGGKVGRWGQAGKDFRADFPGQTSADRRVGNLPESSRYALSLAGKQRLAREQSRLEHQIGLAESGGMFVRQRALLWAGTTARELRRQGYQIGPDEERDLREQATARLRDQIQTPRRDRLRDIDERLMRDTERRLWGATSKERGGADKLVADIKQSLDKFVTAAQAVANELVNVNRGLAAAGPGRK